jgi:heme-degrading monooxygenase HmoA
MIIVHDIFICKPGNASKVAKMFKEAMTGNSELVNIMTDMTGQYNKVVMVTKYDNLAAYEKSFEKYKEGSEEMKKMQAKMAGYQDMYLTGSREIYHVWYEIIMTKLYGELAPYWYLLLIPLEWHKDGR